MCKVANYFGIANVLSCRLVWYTKCLKLQIILVYQMCKAANYLVYQMCKAANYLVYQMGKVADYFGIPNVQSCRLFWYTKCAKLQTILVYQI